MMDYKSLLNEAYLLLEEQPNEVALLANASAFIYQTIDKLNWAGFYLYDGINLKVGPFQGKVACNTIDIGKGVCGEAAEKKETRIIDDVLNYHNHIACDANSRSEIVVPMITKKGLYGVLDVDSPVFNRFNPELAAFFEAYVDILVKIIDKYE